ncbi:hypothetical protein HanOQP8_Chr16g0599561 [Helianthus annuus]|nr:hypothetical protein HanLR1_Chr16g0603051 [Helianthus annuus]KAJ0643344.1 hypothetical protein HanOQP8_Chr16g0599561 [Helianthus annuus]
MIILLTRMHHFITTENISYKRMAPTLLSPATVNHHHHHHRLSILTDITPFVPSVHCSCSTSRITSSHCWSPLPPRNFKLRRRRCRAASPHPPSPPESEPPPGDDQSSSSGIAVFFTVLFAYVIYLLVFLGFDINLCKFS